MTVIFVDGPDGVGKTGYSKWLADELGYIRLEMRPVDSTEDIEAKSEVFNAAIEDLNDQNIDLVIDRGSTSSMVYSRVFDRGRPEHAWSVIETLEPEIVYLRCDPDELAVRYGNNDELFTDEEIREIATTYDEVMDEVDQVTGATVHTVDTTVKVTEQLRNITFDTLHNASLDDE